ncbi:translocation/assembly module TamB [Dysgonomonas sp. OttesenSCG-928-D17]|nr:translocation/assembly module TamB [Dysgonomonas sp. OttesenSCG-928-D17]
MEVEEKVQEEIQPPKKKSFAKKLFRILIYIVLGIIGLNVLLYALLSIPSVQQKAADFAIDELKKMLKTEVSVDEVRLSLFNHATLKGIYIEDQAKDTLLYANSLDVSLSPWELLKSSKLAITGITVDDFLINVTLKDSISDFNFQFIIDAFSSSDTTEVDTTKSSLVIVIEDVSLNRGRLNYDVLSDTITPGIFNASHIALYDVNANLDLNSIDTDKLDIALNNLRAKEKTGIEIKDLKGHLYSERDQMWVEGLTLTLPQSHLITNKARYNLATNQFEVGTEDTEIAPEDLIAFMPELKFLKNKIGLQTDINGTLPAVQIEKVNLTYGEDFYLSGKAGIADYSKYGTSDILINIEKAKASPDAINSFAKLGDSTFVSPDILKDMGDIFLKGQLTGQLNKFKLDAEAWCRQGSINMLATGKVDTTFTNFDVLAGLKTHGFNLGKLLGEDTGLGNLTANLDIKAHQSEKVPLSAEAQGRIEALGYEKETIKNLPFQAYYNADEMGISAKADWKIGKIMAVASMSQDEVPDINVELKVDTLHVDYFYKNPDWVNPRLNLSLNGNIKGLDIDQVTGLVNVDSLRFYDANFNFHPGKFTLEAGRKSKTDKFINLTSSLLTANISGYYTFTTLADEMAHVMHEYLPNVFPHEHKGKKKPDQNDFTFSLKTNNTEELGRIFALPVDVIEPASISGRISTINNIVKIDGDVPYIRYGEYDIKNTTLNISNVDSAFNVVGNSRMLMDKGEYKLSLLVDGAQDAIHAVTNISSDKTDIGINGYMEALAEFSRNEQNELVSSLKVSPSDLMIDKLALNLLPAEIINTGSRTEIHNVGIGLNKKRYFGLDGVVSDQKSDSLRAYFDHAEIGDLLEAFDIKNIRGNIHGNVLLTNLLDQPEVYTRGLEMSDIVMFADTLGTMHLESAWSDEFGGARLNATLINKGETHAEVDGTVYTSQDSLDLQIRMLEMPLRWMQPFVSDMLNKLDGSISTNLMVEGSMKAPKVKGFLGFNNTQIGVDYTNVTYTISDTIRVSPDRIGFDHLTLKDSHGNTANVSATLTHKNFEQMKYSLNMQMNKLMVLNTENRTDSLFYGRVFASGSLNINGDDNGINMKMNVTNDKNSRLNILLPQHSEASDYKSVVYINVPEEKLKDELKNAIKSRVSESLPLKLDVNLNVTPDILLGVIIDPTTGDELQARGSGSNIRFTYDMQTENMTARGDYALSDGFVKLNLQNIKKLQFKIQPGSKLFFEGDPLKTRFDITAYRRVKADLKTLDMSFENQNYSSKVEVDCILEISGNLDGMEVKYNIALPNANDDIMTKVATYISTDEQKTLQFASLVATGSFYANLGNAGSNFGNGIWTNMVSTALSSGLTALVGNMLGDKWTIGANIDSSDGSLSEMDMSVSVSRKFLDDKLRFNTNLGYRTDQTTSAENTFIGDFDLEYQLNSMWTLKAYSHTNDRYYRQAPTTQGIGIVYSKEAATLKRLFQSFKPRRRRSTTNAQDSIQQPPLQQAPEAAKTDSLPSDSTQSTVVKQPMINDERED